MKTSKFEKFSTEKILEKDVFGGIKLPGTSTCGAKDCQYFDSENKTSGKFDAVFASYIDAPDSTRGEDTPQQFSGRILG
jgi:hypothetical protein